MALDATAASILKQAGAAPNQPTFQDVISFPLDTSYPSGGYANFDTFVSTIVGATVDVLGVQNNNNGATYLAFYDKSTKKLLVRGWDGVEASGNLSAVTLQLLVFYK